MCRAARGKQSSHIRYHDMEASFTSRPNRHSYTRAPPRDRTQQTEQRKEGERRGSGISGQHGTASGNGTAGGLNGGRGIGGSSSNTLLLPTNSPMFGLKSAPHEMAQEEFESSTNFFLRIADTLVFGTGETSRTGDC